MSAAIQLRCPVAAAAPPAPGGGGVKFVFSRVKIELQALHEEDLLNFIDDLGKRGRSYLSVRSCDIQRMERGSGGTTLAPRLRTLCVVDLITIRHDKPG